MKKEEKNCDCTFFKHGKEYKPQYYQHCETCWPGETNLGCCMSCAEKCHKDHHKYEMVFSDRFFCDCGENECRPVVPKLKLKSKKDNIEQFYNPEDFNHNGYEVEKMIAKHKPQRFLLYNEKFKPEDVLEYFPDYKVIREKQNGLYNGLYTLYGLEIIF